MGGTGSIGATGASPSQSFPAPAALARAGGDTISTVITTDAVGTGAYATAKVTGGGGPGLVSSKGVYGVTLAAT